MAIAHVRAPIDPEDPREIPVAPIVEWYRIDASRRIATYLTIGSIGMSLGMFAVAGFVVGHGTASLVSGVAGIALVIVGGGTTVLGTTRVLWEESYLALRVDGALFVHGETRRFARWEDVDSVRHDGERKALVIVRDGHEWVLGHAFADVDHEELARRAIAVRRRALHGMY